MKVSGKKIQPPDLEEWFGKMDNDMKDISRMVFKMAQEFSILHKIVWLKKANGMRDNMLSKISFKISFRVTNCNICRFNFRKKIYLSDFKIL